MDWLAGMGEAIDYIENHLTGDIDCGVAARCVGCSDWEFQRLFSFMMHISLYEYIRRRRMTLAAHDIQAEKGKIIDIAMRYGYDSPAAFSRAFSQLMGTTPSSVRSGAAMPRVYQRISFKSIMEEWYGKMSRFSERGYVLKETGPVYYTKDMDATLKWFEDILGWFGDVVERDSQNHGTYGCVYDVPREIAVAHVVPFHGIHLFYGEPISILVAFIMVQGIESLYNYVKSKGWTEITGIKEEAWGSKTCEVRTPDGYTLRFFE